MTRKVEIATWTVGTRQLAYDFTWPWYGLRSLWENLKEKASVYKVTEARDIIVAANAIVSAAISTDKKQGSESQGKKLKTIHVRVLDSNCMETFKKEFLTSLERLLSEMRTLKRGYDGQQSQNAAKKATRYDSQRRICLFSLSTTSGFGDCTRTNSSYDHPRYTERSNSPSWRNVASKIINEGQACHPGSKDKKQKIHADWIAWARTLANTQSHERTASYYGPSRSAARPSGSYAPVTPYQQTAEVKGSEVKNRWEVASEDVHEVDDTEGNFGKSKELVMFLLTSFQLDPIKEIKFRKQKINGKTVIIIKP